MSADATKDQPALDGTPVDANAEKTPAGDASTVTGGTTGQADNLARKTGRHLNCEEQVAARIHQGTPRQETRLRISRSTRERCPERAHSRGNGSKDNKRPRRTFHSGCGNKESNAERIDLDVSDRSDPSDEDADIHPENPKPVRSADGILR
ncbi:hypothetical protein Bca101_017887 [Brassica carinata]